MQPRIVREAEARERAAALGVRLQVVEAQRHYTTTSQSSDDTAYNVRVLGRDFQCDCPGYQFTGVCKHAAALQMRAEREGWGPDPKHVEARELAVAILRGPR